MISEKYLKYIPECLEESEDKLKEFQSIPLAIRMIFPRQEDALKDNVERWKFLLKSDGETDEEQ